MLSHRSCCLGLFLTLIKCVRSYFTIRKTISSCYYIEPVCSLIKLLEEFNLDLEVVLIVLMVILVEEEVEEVDHDQCVHFVVYLAILLINVTENMVSLWSYYRVLFIKTYFSVTTIDYT